MTPRRLVGRLYVAGILLLALGALVFFVWFPHTETECVVFADYDGGLPCSAGNARLSLLGAAIAGVGFLVVLVPIIATGVDLGRRLTKG